jgi:hypothetical protein
VATDTGADISRFEPVLEQLRQLPPLKWPKLVAACQAMPEEKYEDALAGALDKSGLRDEWFALRHAATEIARAAAKAYAAAVGEAPRTLEYNKSVEAWDGHRESAFIEQLPPGEEQEFIDGACGACGVMFMKAYVSESEFAGFWSGFAPLIAA